MKPLLLLLTAVLATASHPETIRTIDGTTYQGVTSLRVAPNSIRFIHRDGAASVRLDALPEDLRQHFGYDPAKSAAADQVESALRRQEVAAAAAQTAAATRKAEAIAILRKKNFGGATYHSSEKWIRDSRDAEAMRILAKAGVSTEESSRIIEGLKAEGKTQRLNVHPEFRKPIGQRRTPPPKTP